MYKIILLIFLMFPHSALSHEGHGHAPKKAKALHGGIIKQVGHLQLEVLLQDHSVKVFAYKPDAHKSHVLKALDVSKVVATAQATRPRKKSDQIKLKAQGDHWVYSYDAKGSHRYELLIAIKEEDGHSKTVKWNIEPKHAHHH